MAAPLCCQTGFVVTPFRSCLHLFSCSWCCRRPPRVAATYVSLDRPCNQEQAMALHSRREPPHPRRSSHSCLAGQRQRGVFSNLPRQHLCILSITTPQTCLPPKLWVLMPLVNPLPAASLEAQCTAHTVPSCIHGHRVWCTRSSLCLGSSHPHEVVCNHGGRALFRVRVGCALNVASKARARRQRSTAVRTCTAGSWVATMRVRPPTCVSQYVSAFLLRYVVLVPLNRPRAAFCGSLLGPVTVLMQ